MNSINRNGRMLIKDAMKIFTDIMRSLNGIDQQTFLSFVGENWKPEEAVVQFVAENPLGDSCTDNDLQEAKLREMRRIVMDIRNKIPFDGILPSEHIVPPITGENSDCDAASTKHVDAFLYDNKDVDELIEEGKLDNLYCADCGSRNIKEYNIISHSMSVSAMLYVFYCILPSLEGKILLDIGSRLGAVLYGAHMFSSARRIIGVEMNKELCNLQSDIIHKYKMSDRVEVVNKRIEECPEIVHTSNIIIMNNPFEFYMSESVHIEIWKFLRANIKKGTIVVTRPPIETTFETLETGILLHKWMKPYEPRNNVEEPRVFGSLALDFDEHSDIKFYEVL